MFNLLIVRFQILFSYRDRRHDSTSQHGHAHGVVVPFDTSQGVPIFPKSPQGCLSFGSHGRSAYLLCLYMLLFQGCRLLLVTKQPVKDTPIIFQYVASEKRMRNWWEDRRHPLLCVNTGWWLTSVSLMMYL